MIYDGGSFDVVVIGAGHAGCEAALACARLGQETLLLTMNMDAIALMACNPAIGGTAKGHLVREVDALGGEMGRAIDDTLIQGKMLNLAKGPAVHSLRAQADKKAYQKRMTAALFAQEHLTVRQGEAEAIQIQGEQVSGVICTTGAQVLCRSLVVACGVYLKSRVIIGDRTFEAGPQGLFPAKGLSASLEGLGFSLRRFKTGTPARIDARTIDFDQMQPQAGDEPVVPFSFLTTQTLKNQALCYLTYTNEQTHEIVRRNLHRAPKQLGLIQGTGARYCPSIEDKIVRFADKDRHQVFLEPEGIDAPEWYVQGLSTGLPEDVQREMYRSVAGLTRCEMTRPAYAIEYDCIDARALHATLGARQIKGLYFAGQVNGTSGYEEAAAQGLLAGVNAALYMQGKPPFVLGRDEAYIGVMVDDLAVVGVDEPYRMMTSRAEYRLHLRQDNADLRLSEKSYQLGLANEERYAKMMSKTEGIKHALQLLKDEKQYDKLKRPEVNYADLGLPSLPSDVEEQVNILVRYEGYLQKQNNQVMQFRAMENRLLPIDIDYHALQNLRIEARQKLAEQRPLSLGQASRIPGVSPGDVQVLIIYLERRRREKERE